MEELNSTTEFSNNNQIKCPRCGNSNVKTTTEKQTFTYGDGPDAAELNVHIPVRSCVDCDFQFTDEVAEETRHEAVCRHLGVMTPKEITGLRKKLGLSRAQFSSLTRIGEASLARWENGLLIQNPAHDQYLFLLSFQDNINRLLQRGKSEQIVTNIALRSSELSKDHKAGQLRLLGPSPELETDAKAFDLQPIGI